ncbi:hypothetical protein D3C76_1284720 [compost metagenome]
MTGKVATLRPMPSSAIKALHSTATMPSGTRMHSTARSERKVNRQNSATEQNSAASIHTSACLTASLAAAITPTLPPARWNDTCADCRPAITRRASLTTWATVAPS